MEFGIPRLDHVVDICRLVDFTRSSIVPSFETLDPTVHVVPQATYMVGRYRNIIREMTQA